MRPPPAPAVPERTGILVIRVWVEQDDAGRLRARLTQAADLGETATTLAVATGMPGICDAVEAWLRRFLDSPER
ncbi:MAG TPA: hypothetical protein VLA80_00395 [Actinomycetota bacterium]|nr:hypothetical protein [Actinomycetota bacterium]